MKYVVKYKKMPSNLLVVQIAIKHKIIVYINSASIGRNNKLIKEW